jgi:hypothetical protein
VSYADDEAIEESEVENIGNHNLTKATEALSVNSLSLPLFRSMLVKHFNLAFHKHEVIWPKCLVDKPLNIPK